MKRFQKPQQNQESTRLHSTSAKLRSFFFHPMWLHFYDLVRDLPEIFILSRHQGGIHNDNKKMVLKMLEMIG